MATVETGLTSVCPLDCTAMKEKMNPRMRARMASPTFMWNLVARIATDMTVLAARPVVHHNVGIRSSTGV